MKKLSLLLGLTAQLLLWAIIPVQAQSDRYDPVANPNAIVTSGNMRFTVLTPELIRIERSTNQTFEDRASFAFINRKLPVPTFTSEEKEGYLNIQTDKLTLRYKIGTNPITNPAGSDNLRITFQLDGKEVVWYPGKEDKHNLKGTMRTLDNVHGWEGKKELEQGILSRSGWALVDESQGRSDGSKSLLFDNATDVPWVQTRSANHTIDWYFFGYGHDYKKALNDFTKVAGKMTMPPLYVFGYWYSKYQKYSQQDFKNIIDEVNTNGVPLDVMVVDMDWHKDGWTGWSWNRNLIPDPAGLLKFFHDKNLKVTLNLHPADGIGTHEDNHKALAEELKLPTDQGIPWNLDNKAFYKGFFKHILKPHQEIGVDFWWIDWQQTLLSSKTSGLSNTFWINHVFYTDMEKNRPERRPVIFHRWGGLGNHRYPIGFSGDTYSDYQSLAFQPYFTATASNVGYGYWSHDIGGHQQFGDNDPELYLRWIQYGVFSPIVRTHSANFSNIERRIWKYKNFSDMNEAIKLRYALIPYIYTYARVAYDTGISLCRPLYYDYPELNEAYDNETQYMFGDQILVAPIVEQSVNGISRRKVWLPDGNWYEVATGTMLEGNRNYNRSFSLTQIPYYYKAGAIVPLFPALSHLKERPGSLTLQFVPGADNSFDYYEDENDNNNYKEDKYTLTTIKQSYDKATGTSNYQILARTGSFDGMPTSRAYQLELLYMQRPTSVAINNTACPEGKNNDGKAYWIYDNSRRCIIVNIPSTACDTPLSIAVKTNGQLALDIPAEQPICYYAQDEQMLNITFPTHVQEARLEIFDISGKSLLTNSYQNIESIHQPLSLTGLTKGIYLCRIVFDKQVFIQKINL